MTEKSMYVTSEEERNKKIERTSKKVKRTNILLAILSLAIGIIVGRALAPRYAKPSTQLLVGLMGGGIVGCIVGFWLGRVSKRRSKAEGLFMLAIQEENQERKDKLLGKLVDRYPSTKWADKVLDEKVRNGIMKAGEESAKTWEKKPPTRFLGEDKSQIDLWKYAQRLRDEGFSIRAIAERLGVPKSTIFDHIGRSNSHQVLPKTRAKRSVK